MACYNVVASLPQLVLLDGARGVLCATSSVVVRRRARTDAMPKSAHGLQQKRTSKKAMARKAMDRDRSLAARKSAKSKGLTPYDERTNNREAAEAAEERKTITKAKRMRRKEAKGAVKAAKEEAKETALQQRAELVANREKRERMAAAAAAAAARAAED